MGCTRPARVSAVDGDGAESTAIRGCRFAERLLLADERFSKWPSPREMAAHMNREYRGTVDWHDVDRDPPDDIVVVLAMDPRRVVLRSPISPPFPQERIMCKSSVVVTFHLAVRLGEAAIEFSDVASTFGADISTTVPVPAEFAGVFASPGGEGYEVTVFMRFDGAAVSGRFMRRDGAYRQAGVFGAR